MPDQSPNAAAAFDQIAVESRENFAGIARARAAHQEEVATGLSQAQQNLSTLYGALTAQLLTGLISPPANAEVAGKNALMYPSVMIPPKAT